MAQDHRAHHADPRDIPLLFIPFRWVLYLIASVLLVGLLLRSWPMRSSFYVAGLAMAALYEWSHFLIHTDYKPKTRMYRHLYDNHRWHHYRNEQYWFGIPQHPWRHRASHLSGEGRGPGVADGQESPG